MAADGQGEGSSLAPPLTRAERLARESSARRKMTSGFTTSRDLIAFTAGLAIVLNEVFLRPGSVEAAAVGVGFALMGLPVAFRADERKR